jgi:hypothetical protein
MAAPLKPTYGPVPVRAAQDRRLTEHTLRTLIVVAAHDRLNRNNAGCYATQRRLAAIIGGDHTRVSKSLSALVALGYLRCAPNAINAKVNVYRVIYSDDDRALMVGGPANIDVGARANIPAHNPPAEETDVGASANSTIEDVGGQNGQTHESKEQSDLNILGETYNTSGETKIHSAEAAPIAIGERARSKKETNQGAYLAMIERSLRAEEGQTLNPIDARYVQEIIDSTSLDDPIYQRAIRILETWGTAA